MAKKTVLRSEIQKDLITGEIKKEKITIQYEKEPAYVKLYFDCLGVFIKNDGLNSSLNDVLIEVLKRTTYAEEGQIVHLDKFTKTLICKATGKSMPRLNQIIATWLKNDIVTRIARGIYQINPWIFGKGEWRNISDLRATFNFGNGIVELEKTFAEMQDPTTQKAQEMFNEWKKIFLQGQEENQSISS